MPSRNIRRTIILNKFETVYGQDSVPTAAYALQVSNVSIKPWNGAPIERDLTVGQFGSYGIVSGSRYVEMSFDIPYVGGGIVGGAPGYAALMLCCGFAGTETTDTRYDLTTVTNGIGSETIYYYDDGLLHAVRGCRGKVTLSMKAGEKPMLSFTMLGLYTPPVVATNPSINVVTGSTWFRPPQAVTAANTGALVIGGTHSLTTAPAITAGTKYASQGLEIDFGNVVEYSDMPGGDQVDLLQRNVTGKVTLDLTPAQEADFYAKVDAASYHSMGMSHGTVDGNRVMPWMPLVQFSNPTKTEKNGKRLLQLDFVATNSNAGNDDIRLVTSF